MEIRDLAVEMNDKNFSGTDTQTLELKKDDTVAFDSKGNVFGHKVVDEAGNEIVSLDNLNGSVTTTIPKDGTYTITVTGSGDFKLTCGNVVE